MTIVRRLLIVLILNLIVGAAAYAGTIVLQSDFGVRDAAVAAMKLVILGVDPTLTIVDNTHDIEPFQIYEGAYRLRQSAPWAARGSVFVSVVDPGVGSKRYSIVARDKRGVLYVTPDNGTLSFVEKEIGIESVRIINENILRRPGSENSHTFHGRDIYAYVGGKLASGQLPFESVGEELAVENLKRFVIPQAKISEDKLVLSGMIEIHDIRYGNLWTNIDEELVRKIGLTEGELYTIRIYNGGVLSKELRLPFLRSFDAVKKFGDHKLIYMNSLGKVACSELLGNFAQSQGVGYGPDWTIEISK